MLKKLEGRRRKEMNEKEIILDAANKGLFVSKSLKQSGKYTVKIPNFAQSKDDLHPGYIDYTVSSIADVNQIAEKIWQNENYRKKIKRWQKAQAAGQKKIVEETRFYMSRLEGHQHAKKRDPDQLWAQHPQRESCRK
jgi:hypothetical protein